MRCWLKKKMWYTSAILVLMLFVSVGANAAQATSNIDPDQQTKVNFYYEPGKTNISIYKIANITPQSRFIVIEPFDAEPFSNITQIQEINGLDAEGYNKLATTLMAYLYTENTAPTLTIETDEKGNGTSDKLGTGMFLAIPEGDADHEACPALFSIPGSLGEDGEWAYTVDVELKYEKINHSDKNLKVIKVWDDNKDAAGSRPEFIEVQLLRINKTDNTSEVKEKAKLNADNNWQKEWMGLDGEYDWTVQETVPNGYAVAIEQNGENDAITITITNTIPKKNPDPTTGTTASSGGGTTQTQAKSSTLPKTGQLWWPVPFLCIGGMVAFVIGYIRRKRWENNHNG